MKIMAVSWVGYTPAAEFSTATRGSEQIKLRKEIYGCASNEQLFHTMSVEGWPAGVRLA